MTGTIGFMSGAATRRRPSGAESTAGTLVTTAGPTIIASSTPGSAGSQNTISISGTGTILVNGLSPGGIGVIALYVIDHSVFQENSNSDWWGPITVSGVGATPLTSPLPVVRLSNNTLAASQASGTAIGTLSVTTGLHGGTIGAGAYTWTYAVSGTGSSNFQVVGGILQSAVTNLSGGPYTITITATPNLTISGGPFALSATITVGVGLSAPAQAAAAGFHSLVFSDDFTTTSTIATSAGATSGFNWYWWSQGVNSASQYNVNTTYVPGVTDGLSTATGASSGVLSLTTNNDGYSEALITVPQNATSATRTGTFNTGYMEAYLYATPIVPVGNGFFSNGDPAWWMFDVKSFSFVNGDFIAECDILEMYPSGDTGSTILSLQGLINWQANALVPTGTSDFSNLWPNDVSTNFGTPAAGWHKWGCLWQGNGTTGTVQFYLDDNLLVFPTMANVNPSGSQFILNHSGATPTTGLTAMPGAFMYLILGGSKSGWPLLVDWVRVWQTP